MQNKFPRVNLFKEFSVFIFAVTQLPFFFRSSSTISAIDWFVDFEGITPTGFALKRFFNLSHPCFILSFFVSLVFRKESLANEFSNNAKNKFKTCKYITYHMCSYSMIGVHVFSKLIVTNLQIF